MTPGKNESMNQTGVIFDMDGVLALTENAHWQSWQAAADARNVDIEYEKFLSCFGRVNPDCIAIMFGSDIPPEESARIAEEKESAFRDILRQNVPLAPGLSDLLKSLREMGLRLAVGSSGPRENVDLILSAGGIRQSFEAIVHGGEVTHGKPSPDVFLLAAKRLGLPPGSCAVIEDAPAGIRAAVAARMLPIAVATTHDSSELKKAGAVAIFPDLASIPLDFFRKLPEINPQITTWRRTEPATPPDEFT
jgi:beta-phosphoglucomutase